MSLLAAGESSGRVVVALGKEDDRRRALDALGRAGYRTEEAADGVVALAAVRAAPVLLLLDLELPGLDGFAVLESMRELPIGARPPVLAASRRLAETPELRAVLREFGGTTLVRLPCPPVELATQVRMIIGAPAAQPPAPRAPHPRRGRQAPHPPPLPTRARQDTPEPAPSGGGSRLAT